MKKVHFSQNRRNLGDRKCPPETRNLFVGLPSAKCFRPVLGDRVFRPDIFTGKAAVDGETRGYRQWVTTPLKMKINGGSEGSHSRTVQLQGAMAGHAPLICQALAFSCASGYP